MEVCYRVRGERNTVVSVRGEAARAAVNRRTPKQAESYANSRRALAFAKATTSTRGLALRYSTGLKAHRYMFPGDEKL